MTAVDARPARNRLRVWDIVGSSLLLVVFSFWTLLMLLSVYVQPLGGVYRPPAFFIGSYSLLALVFVGVTGITVVFWRRRRLSFLVPLIGIGLMWMVTVMAIGVS